MICRLSNGWSLSCGRHEAYHEQPTPEKPDQHRGSVALTGLACSLSSLLSGALEISEPIRFAGNAFYELYLNPQPKLLELVKEALPINQVDGWCAVAPRLTASFSCEEARRENEASIGTAYHGSAEVPDDGRPYAALIPLALKEDWEGE